MADASRTRAAHLLQDAIAQRVFPCAVVCVGSSNRVLWHQAFGHLTFDTDAARATVDTWFDLASLTKPLATTTVLLDLVARNRLELSDPLALWLPAWSNSDRQAVTVGDVLEHASGLAARFADGSSPSRRDFLADICASPLAYAPRAQSIYSDLGFILLGLLAETREGHPLDDLFAATQERLPEPPASANVHTQRIDFAVPAAALVDTAPTEPLLEDTGRTHRLVGEVNDNYAATLGGVAGHAGLFGTAAGVAAFAIALLRAARGDGPCDGPFSSRMTKRATQPSAVAGSSRALGWDLMRPTSSCGSHMSTAAFGHVGFTGTSLWIDPVRDRFYVLLTNRVCGGGTADEMRDLRRAFHDALAGIVG